MTIASIKMPDIGEGVTQAELVEWHVKIGDLIKEDAVLVSVMTDKATVEIPSLYAGEVKWLAGQIGDVVAIGADLARIEFDPGESSSTIADAVQYQDGFEEVQDVDPKLNDRPAGGRLRLSVRLPDVGEGVTEAELVEWHVQPGDEVREDDALAAVMTDKATVEIPSLYSGTVVEVAGAIGDVIAVGTSLVVIDTGHIPGDAGSIIASKPEPGPAGAKGGFSSQAPAAKSSSFPAIGGDVRQAGAPRAEGRAVLASPSVRARARDGGIDIRRIAGSGPAGRISHADLDKAFATPSGAGADDSRKIVRIGTDDIRIVGMRRKIAERMSLANSRIPHITVIEEVDITALEALREKLNADRGDRPKLTMLPFVTAALSRAFLEHPEMNAHFDDAAQVVTRHASVHLGIATMTEAGLVVPVLRHAEALGLFDTASEIARLSSAARTGKAARGELSGSTFTVTSLGPLGALATTPIINHPEVAILGINKMAIRPMWDGSRFSPRKIMNVSASFDHRVIDGWDAAVFVQKIKSLLETPALIFLDRVA